MTAQERQCIRASARRSKDWLRLPVVAGRDRQHVTHGDKRPRIPRDAAGSSRGPSDQAPPVSLAKDGSAALRYAHTLWSRPPSTVKPLAV